MQDQYSNQKDARDLNSKHTHLTPALLAILLVVGSLAYGIVYAQSLEQKYIHALAPLMLPQSNVGSALQQTAFQQPDLLVVYGSSEIIFNDAPTEMNYGSSRVSIGGTPYGASQFFQNYPTGFNLYEITNGGITSLNIAQNLAAIGPELRGKKVVISFTPTAYHKDEIGPLAYAGNFSILHANALIFNPYLSLQTKKIAAQRMNDYPDTLNNDLVLRFAVQRLSSGRWYGRYFYYLSWPFGLIDTWAIRLQDHWEVLNYIWNHPNLNWEVNHRPQPIDWSKQISLATMTEATYSNNNPYGIENDLWDAYYSQVLTHPEKPSSADYKFIQSLVSSKEWIDFDLTLRVLDEMGAQPLILSRPLNGPIWNAKGVSKWVRKQYYVKLQNEVSPYGFLLEDFANYDGDGHFSIDQWSHMSREGWVYVGHDLG